MATRFELANALRALSMDAVQAANSGHPGMPMGMADIAEALWNDVLKHNPANPHWPNRDRFVLSNGHGSMLLYALLHLSGYDVSLDDLKAFRQFGSATPGHPEYGYTPGVETTTGPLGQGIANAVGFALCEAILAETFNADEFPIIDHYTYVFLGDGCLMEGVSHEAASLAGTLKLGKLIAFWDDNGISIDGQIADWFADNTCQRFESYGWHVIPDVDGHDPEAVLQAISNAKAHPDKPTLIDCRTTIGFGSPKVAGTAKAHGAPLGPEEVEAARRQLDWAHPAFSIPEAIRQAWDARERGANAESKWTALWESYQAKYPEKAKTLAARWDNQLSKGFRGWANAEAHVFQAKGIEAATRKSSEHALDQLIPELGNFLGGSADLSGSNNTKIKAASVIKPGSIAGDYLHYGVREFGMSAIMNGIALYGGFIPFGGTFLVFSDYARNAVRLSALMKQRVIYVYSHDSIGLGEDGPTHQPVEHLTSLREMPGLHVWRPADMVETWVAWCEAVQRTDGPAALVLTRQGVPAITRTSEQVDAVKRGAYIVYESKFDKDAVIFLATGSELQLALAAGQRLSEQGHGVRVVSMPCAEVFEAQEVTYREEILPRDARRRVSVEAGSAGFWHRYIGLDGRTVSIETFGESGPGSECMARFGFTVDAVYETALSLVVELEGVGA